VHRSVARSSHDHKSTVEEIPLRNSKFEGRTSMEDLAGEILQKKWDHILAQAELAFNNSVNRSSGKSPFEIVYGRQPRGVTELRELDQDEFRSIGA
jgi:hypothetical protein